ncbi:MAG: IS4 family transposase [Ruminococcus bicirculans]|nr:IS4 family transposase [Ruminococcus bicirculans (ex Wegman et al. 2014)]
MNQFFYQITRKASDLINSDDYRERNITRQTAFTRNRKLSFPVMIVLLLNFLTRTMQIELDDFFANVLDAGTDSVTKQAFFKARKNILPDAFKELFLMTRDMVLNKNKIKRHKGYRILAIDGSELRLDKTKENKDIFLPRNHSPENKTNAEISLLYDVISHYVIDAQIGSIGVCEREYAKKNLAHFSSICDEKDIVIFDRGYPSRDMIAILTGMGCKYLMRLQASCFKGVKENPSNDFRITVSTKTDTYSVRVVRVILKSGEIETLITNLSEDEFSTDDFLDLYFLRWGIETTYDTLKNKLLIEKFSGRSPVAVLQEYYAMMFVLNCIAAMSATVNRKLLSRKTDCKYQYKANVNLMIGYFKYRLSAMLLFAGKALDICRQLILLCLKQPVPMIKGRSAPRPEFSHQRKVFCPKYSI